jgi:SAM-dependent methyltransferase
MSARSRGHRSRSRWLWARFYAWASVANDAAGARNHRRELVSGLSGRVVEVGAGSGLNFTHYPGTVTMVIAVEPQRFLAARAAAAAVSAPVAVQPLRAVAEALPLRTASCDAGVVSLVLCTVDEPHEALGELHRVIRHGGELRFYEHVLSDDAQLAAWQHRADPLWSHLHGGCHLVRTTLAAIGEVGFRVEECRLFHFTPNVLSRLAAPHLVGCARR